MCKHWIVAPKRFSILKFCPLAKEPCVPPFSTVFIGTHAVLEQQLLQENLGTSLSHSVSSSLELMQSLISSYCRRILGLQENQYFCSNVVCSYDLQQIWQHVDREIFALTRTYALIFALNTLFCNVAGVLLSFIAHHSNKHCLMAKCSLSIVVYSLLSPNEVPRLSPAKLLNINTNEDGTEWDDEVPKFCLVRDSLYSNH